MTELDFGLGDAGDSASETPAEKLIGLTLDDGWKVTERLVRSPDATGGNFSIPYVVEHSDGRKAFLKALDLTKVDPNVDLIQAIEAATSAFNHERRLVEHCSGRSLGNVIRGISSGSVKVDASPPLDRVSYILFELASGDARTAAERLTAVDLVFGLRFTHGIANGIRQLHEAGIHHQDLKPSNALLVTSTPKVSDLGRSILVTSRGPWDTLTFAGDLTYAPPEVLYRGPVTFGIQQRLNDLYAVGSMLCFMVVGVSMTAAAIRRVDPSLAPGQYGGNFEDAQAFLRPAFAEVFDIVVERFPSKYKKRGLRVLRELCDPDPVNRGCPSLPKNSLQRLGMSRYVTELDLFAREAELVVRSKP
jgi:eukaryotic-like serine/threonine-protein kinase